MILFGAMMDTLFLMEDIHGKDKKDNKKGKENNKESNKEIHHKIQVIHIKENGT